MPRYDYRCKSCGNSFELRQGFDSDPVADCPNCGSGANRVIHSVPVVFKGSGFYVNDYGRGNGSRASSESKESKEEKSEKSEKPDKGEKKAESTTKSESSKETTSATKKS